MRQESGGVFFKFSIILYGGKMGPRRFFVSERNQRGPIREIEKSNKKMKKMVLNESTIFLRTEWS